MSKKMKKRIDAGFVPFNPHLSPPAKRPGYVDGDQRKGRLITRTKP